MGGLQQHVGTILDGGHGQHQQEVVAEGQQQQQQPLLQQPQYAHPHPTQNSSGHAAPFYDSSSVSASGSVSDSVSGSVSGGSAAGSASRVNSSLPSSSPHLTASQMATITGKLSQLCARRAWYQLEQCVRYKPSVAPLSFRDARFGRKTTILHEALGWLDGKNTRRSNDDGGPDPVQIAELERQEVEQRKSLIRAVLTQSPRSATVKNEHNCVPLVYALRSGSRNRGKLRAPHVTPGIVRDVLRANPDALHSSVSTSGKTLLHVAVMDSGNANVIQLIVDEDASIISSTWNEGTRSPQPLASRRDNKGWIPLHYACYDRYSPHSIDVLKVLITAHPQGLHARTNRGDTPLTLAQSALQQCEKDEEKTRMRRAVNILLVATQKISPTPPLNLQVHETEVGEGSVKTRSNLATSDGDGSCDGKQGEKSIALSEYQGLQQQLHCHDQQESQQWQRQWKEQQQQLHSKSLSRKRAHDKHVPGGRPSRDKKHRLNSERVSNRGGDIDMTQSYENGHTERRNPITGVIAPQPEEATALPVEGSPSSELQFSQIVAHLTENHRTAVELTKRRIDLHVQNGKEHEEKRERLTRRLAKMSEQIKDKSTELREKGFDIPKMVGMDCIENSVNGECLSVEQNNGDYREGSVPSQTLSFCNENGMTSPPANINSISNSVASGETGELRVSSSISSSDKPPDTSIFEENLILVEKILALERDHEKELNGLERRHDDALDVKSDEFQKDVTLVKDQCKKECDNIQVAFRDEVAITMRDAAEKIRKNEERVKEEMLRCEQFEEKLPLFHDYVNDCILEKSNLIGSQLERVKTEQARVQDDDLLRYEQQIIDLHEEFRRSEKDVDLLLRDIFDCSGRCLQRTYGTSKQQDEKTQTKTISVETISRLRAEIESLEELVDFLRNKPLGSLAEDNEENVNVINEGAMSSGDVFLICERSS